MFYSTTILQAYDDVCCLHKFGFFFLDFSGWLDPYMKWDYDMQVHVALSSSYLMV
jgi:hypothetical protein